MSCCSSPMNYLSSLNCSSSSWGTAAADMEVVNTARGAQSADKADTAGTADRVGTVDKEALHNPRYDRRTRGHDHSSNNDAYSSRLPNVWSCLISEGGTTDVPPSTEFTLGMPIAAAIA